MRDYRTHWVCTDCYFAEEGYELDGPAPGTVIEPHPSAAFYVEPYTVPVPLNLLEGVTLSPGLVAEEHAEDCPVWLGNPDRPDVPVAGAECECERQSFSSSPCEGCGSHLAGERHALTSFVS